MRRRWKVLLVVGWALFTFGPLLGALLAGAVADAHGCTLNEGSVHPCVIGGWDAGELLYAFGVMGWLMLVTVPVGTLTGIAGLGAWIAWLIARRARLRA